MNTTLSREHRKMRKLLWTIEYRKGYNAYSAIAIAQEADLPTEKVLTWILRDLDAGLRVMARNLGTLRTKGTPDRHLWELSRGEDRNPYPTWINIEERRDRAGHWQSALMAPCTLYHFQRFYVCRVFARNAASEHRRMSLIADMMNNSPVIAKSFRESGIVPSAWLDQLRRSSKMITKPLSVQEVAV